MNFNEMPPSNVKEGFIRYDQLSSEQQERYQEWLLAHPEAEMVPEHLRESGPEIAEFENLIALFESEHSLEALHAITDLTPAEAPQHPLREPARLALIPISNLLNTLKHETDITREKHEELVEKYMPLSMAVGMLNSNKIRHNR
jgi:hypothetical protein